MRDAIFVRHREPDPEWVAALAQIAPPNPRIPWLMMHWEPGETWEPVQRWMIREMDPDLEHTNALVLTMYQGPSPRKVGHWEGAGSTRRWHSDLPISKRQWDLFQRYRCTS